MTTPTDPKRLYRIVEPAYADLHARDEQGYLIAAAHRTIERFGEECHLASFTLTRKDDESPLPALDEGESFTIVDGEPATASWLLRARGEWVVSFHLRRTPGENAEALLQFARLVVQHRLTERGWSGMLDRARAIQTSLLPRPPLPQLAGFEIAARSDSAEAVGGDIYDVRLLSSHSRAIMIADACGHGLPAALQARDVAIGLRMGAESHLKLAVTIEKLNRILCESTLSSQFVSLIYGELQSDGEFHYVNAGHPHGLLMSSSRIEKLKQTGPVLGVSPDAQFRVRHAIMAPDEVLILYSDGVTESRSREGAELQLEGLQRLVRGALGCSAQELCDRIFAALDERSGGHPHHDDASLVVIRRMAT